MKESIVDNPSRPITGAVIKVGTRIVYPNLGQAFTVTDVTEHGTIKLKLTHGTASASTIQRMSRGVPHADILWVFVERYNRDHDTRIEGIDDDFEEELSKLEPISLQASPS